MTDSHLIVKYLQNTFGEGLKHPAPTELDKVAVVIAVRRVIENWLQDGVRWYRFNTEEVSSWAVALFSSMGLPISRDVILDKVYIVLWTWKTFALCCTAQKFGSACVVRMY